MRSDPNNRLFLDQLHCLQLILFPWGFISSNLPLNIYLISTFCVPDAFDNEFILPFRSQAVSRVQINETKSRAKEGVSGVNSQVVNIFGSVDHNYSTVPAEKTVMDNMQMNGLDCFP